MQPCCASGKDLQANFQTDIVKSRHVAHFFLADSELVGWSEASASHVGLPHAFVSVARAHLRGMQMPCFISTKEVSSLGLEVRVWHCLCE